MGTSAVSSSAGPSRGPRARSGSSPSRGVGLGRGLGSRGRHCSRPSDSLTSMSRRTRMPGRARSIRRATRQMAPLPDGPPTRRSTVRGRDRAGKRTSSCTSSRSPCTSSRPMHGRGTRRWAGTAAPGGEFCPRRCASDTLTSPVMPGAASRSSTALLRARGAGVGPSTKPARRTWGVWMAAPGPDVSVANFTGRFIRHEDNWRWPARLDTGPRRYTGRVEVNLAGQRVSAERWEWQDLPELPATRRVAGRGRHRAARMGPGRRRVPGLLEEVGAAPARHSVVRRDEAGAGALGRQVGGALRPPLTSRQWRVGAHGTCAAARGAGHVRRVESVMMRA